MSVFSHTSSFNCHFCNSLPSPITYSFSHKASFTVLPLKGCFRIHGTSDKVDIPITTMEDKADEGDLQMNKIQDTQSEGSVETLGLWDCREWSVVRKISKNDKNGAPGTNSNEEDEMEN
ncbi:unnamed protein product [Amaranthus hypochondriacus]